jgi:hypothetical protein
VLGPAAGALLVTAVGAPLALIVDALSFLGSAAALLTIRHREVDRPPLDADRTSIVQEIAAGLRYVASRPSLRAFATSSSLANLFLRMVSTVLVLHLIRVVGLSPNKVGVVLSIGEAGFLAGALSVGAIRKRMSMRNTLTLAVVSIASSAWPIALAPSTANVAIALTSAGLFIYGFAAVAWTVSSGAYRQATTPSDLLGRTGSVMRVAAWGPIPVSALVAGTLASATSTRTVLVVAAAGAIAAVAPIGLWRARGAPD